ncbi:MAG: DUF4190 domain-containing protein [Bacteroidia bacterium]|nr:DUF4190 domain-containing protein [Bacteroidia bacterium]
MYTSLRHFLLTLITLCLFLSHGYAAERVKSDDFSRPTLSRETLEVMAGRKLTFKEKLVLPLIKAKVKKGQDFETAASEAFTDGMAVAGFVTGLVSLFAFGFVLGILGIIFSLIGLKRIRREPEVRRGYGLATAGLVLGTIGVVGWALILFLVILA